MIHTPKMFILHVCVITHSHNCGSIDLKLTTNDIIERLIFKGINGDQLQSAGSPSQVIVDDF